MDFPYPYGLWIESLLAAALTAALTETSAATLAVTPTATFAVKPHVDKASTTLAR